MQKILKLHLAGLNHAAELGLYSNKLAADRAIEAICETNPSHMFTIDELRKRFWDFGYLAAGFDELVRDNFNINL